MTIQPEHDVRELLHGTQGSEVVQLRPRVLAIADECRQMAGREHAQVTAHGEPLEGASGHGHVILQRSHPSRERL